MREEDERIVEEKAIDRQQQDEEVAAEQDVVEGYHSDEGEQPIPSHLPEYHRRRQQAINLAQFESFSIDKQRRI